MSRAPSGVALAALELASFLRSGRTRRGPYVEIALDLRAWPDLYYNDRALSRAFRTAREAADQLPARRPPQIDDGAWDAILEAFGCRCAYCGRSDVPLHRDHRMPLALGGLNAPANIVPACQSCNSRKGKQHPDHWPLAIEPRWIA